MSISPLHKNIGQHKPEEPPGEYQEPEPPSFHFKEITPEDWRANEAPLADLYQRGIVSAKYVRERLKIPKEAGTGTMSPAPQPSAKPLAGVKSEVPERWRLRQTKRGIVAERLG